jgi:hypothetical protein
MAVSGHLFARLRCISLYAACHRLPNNTADRQTPRITRQLPKRYISGILFANDLDYYFLSEQITHSQRPRKGGRHGI